MSNNLKKTRFETALKKVLKDAARLDTQYPGFAQTIDQVFDLIAEIDTTPHEVILNKIKDLILPMQPVPRRHTAILIQDLITAVHIGIADGNIICEPSEAR